MPLISRGFHERTDRGADGRLEGSDPGGGVPPAQCHSWYSLPKGAKRKQLWGNAISCYRRYAVHIVAGK
jgi:hypothetical protein